ncbi:MAG: cohesin domain-containing protein [Bacteroidota bacterium]|nr:cohesin domain-containing protein [Bacteroidota bacterium]
MMRSLRNFCVICLAWFSVLGFETRAVVVSVENSPVYVSTMQNYWFYVRVDDVSELFAYSIRVNYDAAKIDVVNIISDNFLGSQGALTTSYIDHSTPGAFTIDEAILGMVPVTVPGGRIVSVQFRAKQLNTPFVVPIIFSVCLMRDEVNNPIPCSSVTGYIYLFHSRVRVKAFLQGSYVASGDSMHTQLRNRDFQDQRSSPYAQDPVVFGDQLPAGVVDWVLVQLRSTYNGPVVASRSAFIRSDGVIVNPTASADEDIPFPVPSGSYYIVIRHRNHLAVQSSVAHSISTAPAVVYNFTTAQSQAWGSEPMATLGTNRYGLWAGDVNGNGQLKYNGVGNDRVLILTRLNNNQSSTLDGYYAEDVNLNGQVKYNGVGNDRVIILINLNNNQSSTRYSQVP